MGDNNENRNHNHGKRNETFWWIIFIIILAVWGLFIVLCFSRYKDGLNIAKNELKDNYSISKDKYIDKTYDEFYSKSYVVAESNNHVKNEASIVINSVRELSSLEVLEVWDVQYVIRNKDSNEEKIETWLEVPGKGVFTVDLLASEFIVDQERKYVKIRIPVPQLTDCTVDYDNIRLLLAKNDLLNESIRDGTKYAEKDVAEGLSMIKNNILSNKQFIQSSKESAVLTLKNIVKSVNKDIPDLKIDIEFFE